MESCEGSSCFVNSAHRIVGFHRAVPAGAGPPYQVSAWTFGDNASLTKACERQAVDEVDVDCYFSRATDALGQRRREPVLSLRPHLRPARLATVSNWNEAWATSIPDCSNHSGRQGLAKSSCRSIANSATVKVTMASISTGVVAGGRPASFFSLRRGARELLHQNDKILAIASTPRRQNRRLERERLRTGGAWRGGR